MAITTGIAIRCLSTASVIRLLMVVIVVTTGRARAATYTWNNPGAGVVRTGSNWTRTHGPMAFSRVCPSNGGGIKNLFLSKV